MGVWLLVSLGPPGLGAVQPELPAVLSHNHKGQMASRVRMSTAVAIALSGFLLVSQKAILPS